MSTADNAAGGLGVIDQAAPVRGAEGTTRTGDPSGADGCLGATPHPDNAKTANGPQIVNPGWPPTQDRPAEPTAERPEVLDVNAARRTLFEAEKKKLLGAVLWPGLGSGACSRAGGPVVGAD